MRPVRVLIPAFCAVLAAAFITGCQSPWVQASVINHSNAPVNLVEVDYPGGSFGVQTIAPHSTFRYRFHILLDDQVTISFTDATGHNHKAKGPGLRQGEEGTLRIEIAPGNTVSWTSSLTPRK